MLQESTLISCPYCGEPLHVEVDCSAGSQSYIEDCQVCCRPIELQMECDTNGHFISVMAKRDDE